MSPPPKHKPLIIGDGRQRHAVCDAAAVTFLLQIGILYLENIRADRLGQPDVHQAAQQIALRLFISGNGDIGISGIFGQ